MAQPLEATGTFAVHMPTHIPHQEQISTADTSVEDAQKVISSDVMLWTSECNLSECSEEDTKMKGQTVNGKQNKCAHLPCKCEVAPGHEFCGEACREAGNEDVEIACQCGHAPCPLTT